NARIDDYRPSDLDTLTSAGEVSWMGVESLGERDGRIALYVGQSPLPAARADGARSAGEGQILEVLRTHGASFFADIYSAVGGFPNDVVHALWNLVWQGAITNDTFHALRSFTRGTTTSRRSPSGRAGAFRS